MTITNKIGLRYICVLRLEGVCIGLVLLLLVVK